MLVGSVGLRAVAIAFGPRPGQFQDLVVVELVLEVIAVAEEVEQLEGGFVRLGDGVLEVFVKQLFTKIVLARAPALDLDEIGR